MRAKNRGKWANPDYVDSILPTNVKVKRPLPDQFDWETSHIFVDSEYGEWKTSARSMVKLKESTHPKRSAMRRALFFKNNPDKLVETRKKAVDTIKKKYSNDDLNKKRIKTNLIKFGTDWPSQSKQFKENIKNNNINKYGVSNVMQVEEFKKANQDAYAVTMQNNNYRSKGESEVASFISDLGFKVTTGFLDFKQFDIIIESKKIIIEFNGLLWHSNFNPKINYNYHLNKTKIANKHGYRLIHIFDLEWENKKEIIKSFIRSALGVNTDRVAARKCEIKKVNKQEAREFLDKNHLLGSCAWSYCYGLYEKNQLISLITLGKHHRGTDTRLVLSRFANIRGVNVQGGLSRLCKHASNLHGELITWIDLRLATTKNWEKSGWTVETTLPPDYFYYDNKNHKITSKQSRKKSLVGTPAGMTEREHATKDRLYVVYDCGKARLSFKTQTP